MKLARIGMAVGLGLAVVAAVMTLSARASSLVPAYTSYGSGDFFFPPYPSDADRVGLSGSIGYYTPTLHASWYMDWLSSLTPAHPGGVEYARTVYLNVNTPTGTCGRHNPASQRNQVVESITGTALIANLQANPGALWLIGNEPDSIYNNSAIMPELYAELYHEFYTFIKTYDPSARVAIGAIVQPTPLRLEYLDKVLNRYESQYGAKLPTDVWNIHLYALPEAACGPGGGVPPGASSTVGVWYNCAGGPCWKQMIDINVVESNLRAMRRWMANRGERDKPLIITEFGELIPDDGSWTLERITFTPQVTRDFLVGSITRMLTATDALIGYPADGNRLVQMWAWYSLHDPYYGGSLLAAPSPASGLTPAGAAYAQLAASLFTPTVDLYPAPLVTPTMPGGTAGPVSVSLTVQVDNRGNTAVGSVPVRFAQYDSATGQLLSATDVTLSQVLARYAGTQPQVSLDWTLTSTTQYIFTFEIDPRHTISQTRRSSQILAYPGAPDLAVTSLASNVPTAFLWVSPTTATLTATIRNMGTLTSPMSAAQFSLLSAGVGTVVLLPVVPLPPVAPNAWIDVTGTFVIPLPGAYSITATVAEAGPDLNPQNNTASLGVFAAYRQLYLPLALRWGP